MIFRRIVMWALLVGLVSGLLLSAVQFWQVIPVIHSAERFESEAPPAQEHAGHEHGGHEHDAGAWAPADGVERIGYTLLSNVLTAAGFALLVLAAMTLSGKSGGPKRFWMYGLLWGGAGYAVFFLAPSIGLPPEIPGAAAAPLQSRQLWWLLAVVCTGAGLAGAAFGKAPWRWIALGLLVVPHLVGAPPGPPDPFAGQSPAAAAELASLARQFVSATAIANAVLWLAIGLTSAWAVRKIDSPLHTNA